MIRLLLGQNPDLVMWVIIALLTSACNGPQAAVHESWTLGQLLTRGERIESTREVIQVRNCGVAERKTVECSAGTSNDLSVSLALGTEVGEIVEITVEPSIGIELGFSRSGGESLELDTPPAGYVYRYTLTKEYRIVSGQALAHSSTGEEQQVVYTFQASCSLRIEPPQKLSCVEAGELLPTPSTPLLSSPTSTSVGGEEIPAQPSPTNTPALQPPQPLPTSTSAPQPTELPPTETPPPPPATDTPPPTVVTPPGP